MERYRIMLLRDGRLKFIAITWSREKDAQTGDCFVRAISEKTKVREGKISVETHSEPMTLDEIRKHVENHMHLLGSDIGRCMGLSLQDRKDEKIYFEKPIAMN